MLVLSPVAAVKLVSLFELFTSPRILYAAEGNQGHVALLLEIFNNLIQYQYGGNSHLIYAIVRRKSVFDALDKLTLPGAIAAAVEREAQRAALRKGEEHTPSEEDSSIYLAWRRAPLLFTFGGMAEEGQGGTASIYDYEIVTSSGASNRRVDSKGGLLARRGGHTRVHPLHNHGRPPPGAARHRRAQVPAEHVHVALVHGVFVGRRLPPEPGAAPVRRAGDQALYRVRGSRLVGVRSRLLPRVSCVVATIPASGKTLALCMPMRRSECCKVCRGKSVPSALITHSIHCSSNVLQQIERSNGRVKAEAAALQQHRRCSTPSEQGRTAQEA